MKERLTGAIILVVLIVLLVPELLSGPKGPSAPATVPAGAAANSPEEPPLRSYTINLGDDSHSRAATAGGNGPAMPQPTGPDQATTQDSSAESASAQSGTPQAGRGQSAATRAGAPQSGGPQAGASQAGVASKPQSSAPQTNASQHGSSQPPTTRSASTTQPQTRRETGTAPAQTRAPTAQAPTPHVASAAPSTPKPSNTVAAPKAESGWAVQLGVFRSRENAERLALDVRTKGFKVSVSPVTSGSSKLYRVRVGPAPDRAAAQELQGRLKAAGRAGGTVVPYS